MSNWKEQAKKKAREKLIDVCWYDLGQYKGIKIEDVEGVIDVALSVAEQEIKKIRKEVDKRKKGLFCPGCGTTFKKLKK